MDAALDEYLSLGGQSGRLAAYQANAKLVQDRLGALGFECLIPVASRSAVILTFGVPQGGWFDFDVLYDRLAAQGYYLYPGKLPHTPSFRVGCIGDLSEADFEGMLNAFEAAVHDLRPVLEQSAAS